MTRQPAESGAVDPGRIRRWQGIGALNGRPALRSGARQLVVGGIAAAVTFGVGHLIGGAVS
jgi:hypothetical protein